MEPVCRIIVTIVLVSGVLCIDGTAARRALAQPSSPLVIYPLTSPGAKPAPLTFRALDGWWLAIDDTFPKLWEQGVTPMEEVLIINGDGRFEDRAMNFHSGSAEICAATKVCSDLPVIAYGRLRVAGNALHIGERGTPPNRLDSEKADAIIRRAAFSSGSPWTIKADRNVMTLQNASSQRMFARIDPQKLRPLRAGMMASGLPAQLHWRCFLGNAMAPSPAFAALRKDTTKVASARGDAASAPPSPEAIARYLRVASYLMTLDLMTKFPINDNPATSAYLGNEPEQLMLDEFPGVKPPATLNDVNALKAAIAAIETRVRDKMKERATGGTAPATPGKPVISDAEIDAFAQAASEEPAAKALFCRE
ncbi:MAG: hypothetical protein ACXWKC_00750 [Xanthobacteraceae bacterium]